MNTHRHTMKLRAYGLHCLIISFVICSGMLGAQTKPASSPGKASKSAGDTTVDSRLLGVWGVDERGGYDFRANGTFIMEGSITYKFDAWKGVWHHWQPAMPTAKITAEYKISADGKSLSINLKKGTPFANLKKIK